MRVLVTGGAGFIGANLCRELERHPAVTEVLALDDLSTGIRANLAGTRTSLLEGSILDAPLLDRTCGSVDSIVHLAARPSVPKSLADPEATHDVNVTGTLRVLEAARAHDCHVVTASSSSVYGASQEMPKRESMPTRPLSPYGASKLAAEAYTCAYRASFGLPTLAFRFFNVYGPLQPAHHDYAAVIPAFVSRALSGHPVTVYGDGKQTRDFTFVQSVVGVLVDAVVRRVTDPDPVNLAFGTRCTLLELVAALEEVLGQRIAVEHHDPRPGDIRDSQAAQQRLNALFPEAMPVPLEEGLAATVAWFRGQQSATAR